MTKNDFIRIKLTARKPQFKELIDLKESGKTADLLDFCTMMHANSAKTGCGSKCEIFTKRGRYIYTIYTNAIVGFNVDSGKRTMYTL
jgi:hypothetical protein